MRTSRWKKWAVAHKLRRSFFSGASGNLHSPLGFDGLSPKRKVKTRRRLCKIQKRPKKRAPQLWATAQLLPPG